MCGLSDHVKFCTCGTDRIDPDRCWRLYREIDGQIGRCMVGDIAEMTAEEERALRDGETAAEAKLIAALRSGTAFDFAYIPQTGDLLEVTLNGETHFFAYSEPVFGQGDPAWSAAGFAAGIGDKPSVFGNLVERPGS